MSEIKNFIVGIIVFIVWSAIMFVSGYLLSDRNATKRINEANNELAEQQRKYDELIKETDERIRDIREQLLGKVLDNGKTAKELSGIIEQIKRQRIDL